jgi:molybdopterin biosynthesis enzyme MoaB
LINKVAIIPTGNEILSGVVIDTNSPAIMQEILENYPACQITRFKPVIDKESNIVVEIDKCVKDLYDLIIVIGGSGGGHRFEKSLSEDYSHTAMSNYLADYSAIEIYGKNGHLWSKIVCGTKNLSTIINVPGPYVEALAAAKAILKCAKENIIDKNIICERVSEAVISNYPSGGEVKCVRI